MDDKLRSIVLVIDSNQRDLTIYPSYRNFSVRLPMPIRYVKAIRMLSSDVGSDIVILNQAFNISLNGYSKVRYVDSLQRGDFFARILPGRSTYPQHPNFLLDPYTITFENTETIDRFDVQIFPLRQQLLPDEDELETNSSYLTLVLNVLYEPHR